MKVSSFVYSCLFLSAGLFGCNPGSSSDQPEGNVEFGYSLELSVDGPYFLMGDKAQATVTLRNDTDSTVYGMSAEDCAAKFAVLCDPDCGATLIPDCPVFVAPANVQLDSGVPMSSGLDLELDDINAMDLVAGDYVVFSLVNFTGPLEQPLIPGLTYGTFGTQADIKIPIQILNALPAQAATMEQGLSLAPHIAFSVKANKPIYGVGETAKVQINFNNFSQFDILGASTGCDFKVELIQQTFGGGITTLTEVLQLPSDCPSTGMVSNLVIDSNSGMSQQFEFELKDENGMELAPGFYQVRATIHFNWSSHYAIDLLPVNSPDAVAHLPIQIIP